MGQVGKEDMTDAEAIRRIRRVAAGLAHHYYWEDTDDMLSDGWIGYHEAKTRYCEDSGVYLWTFAEHRVRGAIIDGIRLRARFFYLGRKGGRQIIYLGGLTPAPWVPDHCIVRSNPETEWPTKEEVNHRREVARKMRNEGSLYKKIAEALGVTTVRAWQYVNQ